MYLGKNIKIYPTEEQKRIINSYIDMTRTVYNYFLKYATDTKDYDIKNWKMILRDLIKNNEIDKIGEFDYLCLLKELDTLNQAFTKFFQNKSGHPAFKKKDDSKGKFKLSGMRVQIAVIGNKITLPVLGEVKFKSGYNLVDKKIYNVTIKKSIYNCYEASLLTEEFVKFFKKTYKSIGIDLGVRKLITASNGKTYVPTICFDEIDEKISNMRKNLSKKETNSNNYLRIKMQIEKLYKKRLNYMHDMIQKATTELVKNYDIIYMEDLDIRDLVKGQFVKTIRRNLLTSSFGYIKEVLAYKCKMYGKTLVCIDRFYPSSQICSSCGFKHNPGSKEVFKCPVCGIEIDRDFNAAKNILNYARQSKTEDSPVSLKNPTFKGRKL